MSDLQGVLARIPGLAGYLAQKQYDEESGANQLQRAGGLLGLKNAIDTQNESAQVRGILAASPDTETAISQLQRTPTGITAATHLQALDKARKDAALTAQMGDLSKLNPDQLDFLGGRLALGGHPGASTVMNIADRRRKEAADAGALSSMRSQGPVGEQGPQIPREGVVPQFLLQDPQFGPSAKALMDRINRGAITTTSGVESELSKLTTAYNAAQTGKALASVRAEARLPDPTAIESNAKAIADYKLPPLQGQSLRSPGSMETMKRVMEINPDYNAQNYAISLKTRNAFSTGVEGRTVRSFNVAIDHLETLSEASTALKNGDIKRFNQAAQRIAEETGEPAPTNFDAVKGIVAKELVKAVVGNAQGGGVTERQELSQDMSRSNAPQQLNGMIEKYQVLMAGQLKGLKKQYESGLGGDDFEKKLLPRSLEIFKKTQQTAPAEGWTPEKERRYQELLKKRGT